VRFLALLLLLPVQEDKGADLVYRAMCAKIETAKTVRAEYGVTVGEVGRAFVVLSCVLQARGKDRWTMEFKVKEERRRRGVEQSLTLLSDGRKVIATGGAERYPAETLKPETVGAEIRQCLATAMIGQAMYIEPSGGERDENRHKPPVVGPVKSGGKDKVGERDALVLEYTLKFEGGEFGGEAMAVKLWVDAATKLPLKREVGFQGVTWAETFTALVLDEEIPDSAFTFQSKRRLAAARAAQVAESVRLYGHYTGRHPRTLDDLAKRPAFLEPEVFFPPGGFVLGSAVPVDPWGRPFELRMGVDGVRVASLGADGKPGGKGDDEDLSFPVPAVTRRAVGAANERLEKQFTARVQLQLLAASVRAFAAAYGELPKKKAALWEKPEWAEVWPEGGWIAGAQVPNDPWGEPYRVVTDAAFVRVQVNDPKARLLPIKSLKAEERMKLEEIARPRLSEAERAELAKIFDELGDDDLETREKAQARLATWGPAALAPLEARAKAEKDREARSRLEVARESIPPAVSPWMTEMASLSVGVGAGTGGGARGASNERNASACLKTLASAEADFRANDRDGNKVNDFWTGDVAGLYTLKSGGDSIKLIELSIALADAAPLEAGAAAGQYVAPSTLGNPGPKAGYHYRVMTHDNSSGKSEPYATSTGGTPDLGKVHHVSCFGFCAYPAEYGATGTKTYIINEGYTIFWKDTQGEPVLEWPTDAELKADWTKLD
jgi:hypothetical protein